MLGKKNSPLLNQTVIENLQDRIKPNCPRISVRTDLNYRQNLLMAEEKLLNVL